MTCTPGQLGAKIAFEPLETPGHEKIAIYLYGGKVVHSDAKR